MLDICHHPLSINQNQFQVNFSLIKNFRQSFLILWKQKKISATETIATIVCLVCLISALVLSAFFIVFVFGSLTMLKQGHDMEWTAPQQVYVPLKKSLFNLAIVMNFGVDVAVEKHTVDGFQSPITVSVLGSKPNLNASAIVGTYDNLKLSKNSSFFYNCPIF